MRAISLWQPWGSLWVAGIKIHETRHWATTYRGPLIVHAAKKICTDIDDALADLCVRAYGPDWKRNMPRGALIGRLTLDDCLPAASVTLAADDAICGDFSPGRFAWRAIEPVAFRQPIPYKGHQGFFDVPKELIV